MRRDIISEYEQGTLRVVLFKDFDFRFIQTVLNSYKQGTKWRKKSK